MMENGILLPKAASTLAADVDAIYLFLIQMSGIVFLIILALIIYFVIRYHRSKKGEVSEVHEHFWLETTWTIIPTIVFLIVAVWGVIVYRKSLVVSKDALVVQVVGRQWFWEFSYPSGIKIQNDLYVPVGKPVLLEMTSGDVIHSFYVPQFRGKKDIVPGMTTHLTFTATEEGDYDIYCTEFCGTGHSQMIGKVKVVGQGWFNRWQKRKIEEIEALKSGSMDARGASLFQSKGCVSCHTVDGVVKVGPSFKGLFGSAKKFTDGSSLLNVDKNYIKESLMDPSKKIVAGFQPLMPTFQGQLSEDEVNDLVEYIKSLK